MMTEDEDQAVKPFTHNKELDRSNTNTNTNTNIKNDLPLLEEEHSKEAEDDEGEEGGDSNVEHQRNGNSKTVPSSSSSSYNDKKPKWWRNIARRKGTKSQRKAIHTMTQLGYVIPKLNKYQHVIDVQKLVNTLPRGTPLIGDELFVPRDDYGDDAEGDEETKLSAKDKIIHLEIGFGQGENLLTNAMMNPNGFYIGAEIHQPGVGMALNRMKQCLIINGDDDGETPAGSAKDPDMNFWREQDWWVDPTTCSSDDADDVVGSKDHTTEADYNQFDQSIDTIIEGMKEEAMKPYDNLRIFPGDGVKILRFLPPSSVDNIYLTFPDPWPKRGNAQYRVIQEDTVDLIRSILKPGGCFYLATDATVFDEWTREVFSLIQQKTVDDIGLSEWEMVEPCPCRSKWLPVLSKYEKKGHEEGRYTILRCWRSNST